MGRVLFAGGKPAMEVPVKGIALSTIAEGSIVYLNENGSPVEFYVAKHDYESGLNGAGRTLLARKEPYKNGAWDSNSSREYSGSTVDTFLNGTYKAVLDSEVQSAIGTTKFYYTKYNNGSPYKTTLGKGIFLPSVWELAGDSYVFNSSANSTAIKKEGSVLPTAAKLRVWSGVYHNQQWTRTICIEEGRVGVPWYVSSGRDNTVATGDTQSSVYEKLGIKPHFTLPSTALFNEETLEFKGVS